MRTTDSYRILIKSLLPLVLLGAATSFVSAQFPKRVKLPKTIEYDVPTDLSTQLSRRVEETYKRALREQNHYPVSFLWTVPSRRYRKIVVKEPDSKIHLESSGRALAEFLPTDVYPYASFLKQEHLPNYFLVKHNLEIMKWLPILAREEQEFTQRVDEFEPVRQVLTHPAAEDMAWLSRQITPQHRYLLVGEEHDLPNARTEVSKLMEELGKLNREVLVFTEFLPENQKWSVRKTTHDLPQYIPIWQSAENAHIEVIGLEPEFMTDTFRIRFVLPRRFSTRLLDVPADIWSSVEGVRIRNERWLAILNRYRELYPQALFVIYAGTGHLEYGMPYSLGDTFAGSQTLVALIHRRDKNWAFGHLPDRILKFNDTQLSRLVGFDISFELLPKPDKK